MEQPLCGASLGLAILRRGGLAAWMEACIVVSPPAGRPPAAAAVPACLALAGLRGELTMVIAAMALSAAPPRRSSTTC